MIKTIKENLKRLACQISPEIKIDYRSLRLIGPREDHGFLRALARGQRDVTMTRILLEGIGKDSRFVDVGGHLGQFSIAAAHYMKLNGVNSVPTIFVFEPHKRSMTYLRRNIKLNNLEAWVRAEELCLGNKHGEVDLFADVLQSDFTSTIAGADGSSLRQTIRVQMTTLDDYCKTHGFQPDVVKVDVEGAELQVLDGMRDVLNSGSGKLKLFIESNDEALMRAGSSSEDLIRRLLKTFASVQWIDEARNRILPVTNPTELNGKCVNLYCI